jgi:hypothetical protein
MSRGRRLLDVGPDGTRPMFDMPCVDRIRQDAVQVTSTERDAAADPPRLGHIAAGHEAQSSGSDAQTHVWHLVFPDHLA